VTTCSALASTEPLAGTAPEARAWIILEQPGPWGRDALLDSHLDPEIGRRLAAAKPLGVTTLLARHPDRPERSGSTGRQAWIARPAAGGMLLRRGSLEDIGEVARWDLAALALGQLPPFGVVEPRPWLFVCTHSGRDRCCAIHGRALAAALLKRVRTEQRERIWECSHVGGHRFAPVTLSLPSGAVHGRLTADEAVEVVELADRRQVLVPRFRGRSCYSPACQAAGIEVRRRFGIDGVDDIDVLAVVSDRVVPVAWGHAPRASSPDGAVLLEVRHADGRAWRVHLEEMPLEGPRPESCGADPVQGATWTVTDLADARPWS
jgi:hypothetical protein